MLSVEARVICSVCRSLGIRKEGVMLSSDIAVDLGADSLDLIELAIGIEAEFGINIPSNDIDKFYTVGDIVRYVNEGKV